MNINSSDHMSLDSELIQIKHVRFWGDQSKASILSKDEDPRAEAQRRERKEDPDLPDECQHTTVIGAQEAVQPRREQPGQEDSGSGDGTGRGWGKSPDCSHFKFKSWSKFVVFNNSELSNDWDCRFTYHIRCYDHLSSLVWCVAWVQP